MANKAIVALFVFCVVATSVDALKCFQCEYTETKFTGDTPWVSEDSCETGKTLKEELSVDCAKQKYVPVADGSIFGVPKSSRLLSKTEKDTKDINPLQLTNNTAYSCVKLTVDGKFLKMNENLKLTLRTCVMAVNTSHSLPDKCYTNEMSRIKSYIKEQLLVNLISMHEKSFEDSSKTGICSCSTDNCNGAINSVSASIVVVFISTFLTYFSKIL